MSEPGSSEQQNGLSSSPSTRAPAPAPDTDTDTAAAVLGLSSRTPVTTAVAPGSASAGGPASGKELSIASMLDRIGLAAGHRKEAKQKYAFWETQPVMQFDEPAAAGGGGSDVSVSRQGVPACSLARCCLLPEWRALCDSTPCGVWPHAEHA
jgi:hypothetical protein